MYQNEYQTTIFQCIYLKQEQKNVQPKPNPIDFTGDPHRVGEDGARGGKVPGVDNAGAPALKEEQHLISEQRRAETREKEARVLLSSSVRESQEKERAHAERTKYWTLLGLIVWLLAGIIAYAISGR